MPNIEGLFATSTSEIVRELYQPKPTQQYRPRTVFVEQARKSAIEERLERALRSSGEIASMPKG